ncbi:MAG TPA: HYR domain-containing protein [Pirellulaceae bacterium]|jgi:probable HAF family extracellular repeat protein|nr:HYR domain-containing protein [Pirellulaceae bacterium]
MKRLAIAVLFLGCAGSTAFAQTGEIQTLGHLLPGSPFSSAQGVSPDGQIVTGQSRTTFNRNHVFLWTPPGPIQDLGAFIASPTPNIDAIGNDVSANGVVVGETESQAAGPPLRAFRKIGAGAIQLLPNVPGLPAAGRSRARDVSDDGALIVGATDTAVAGQTRGFVFSAANAQTLALGPIVPNTGNCEAYACSADGSVIVGGSSLGALVHACIFVVGGNAKDLGTIDNDPSGQSVALDVSANGTVVVGFGIVGGLVHASRWTQATGMIDLGSIGAPSNQSQAFGVSDDGTVVGFSQNPGFGGTAAIWPDGPGSAAPLLGYLQSVGADTTGWTTLENCTDISDDGRVIVGVGTFNGAQTAFRVTITPNSVPSVTAPTPVSVECDGVTTTVGLTATVNDGDAGDLLTVTWKVNGALQKTQNNVVPGSVVGFEFQYLDGASNVLIEATDGKDSGSAMTTVTIVDTTKPIVIVQQDVSVKVDKGEIFATPNLKKPNVTDVCDSTPTIVNDAPNKFPIGVTKVRWTVTDDDGNKAQAVQKVTVVNAAPIANAGADVTKKSSAKRVRVRLNGKKSTDADKHDLTYLWTSSKAKITNPTDIRPTASVKKGISRVKLTVTDEAGAKSTDLMRIRVVAVGLARAGATRADASVRAAHDNASASLANGGGASAAQGLSLTRQAYALGALAGTETNVDGDASAGDLTAYLSLRQQQANVARQAGDQFLQSFLASGDENALAASLAAYSASGHAQADLSSSEVAEVLAATLEQDDE